MSIEFFQTRMGQIFFESTMPKVASQLERIANAMEAAKHEPTIATASLYSLKELTILIDALEFFGDAEPEDEPIVEGLITKLKGEIER